MSQLRWRRASLLILFSTLALSSAFALVSLPSSASTQRTLTESSATRRQLRSIPERYSQHFAVRSSLILSKKNSNEEVIVSSSASSLEPDGPSITGSTTTAGEDPSLLSRQEAVRRLLNQPRDPEEQDDVKQIDRRNTIINIVTSVLLVACGVSFAELFVTSLYTPAGFRRLPSMQYIAALGDANASQGGAGEAQKWGLWRQDPGPRGVFLRDFESKLKSRDNTAPAGWKFDNGDWWLDEHGIIMERPDFPLPPGRYLVSGGRWVTTGLTVRNDGSWALDEGHTLYEVTHLPCRSARYSPVDRTRYSPQSANLSNFPVQPGAEMPAVEGCTKQDYAVLLLVGKSVE